MTHKISSSIPGAYFLIICFITLFISNDLSAQKREIKTDKFNSSQQTTYTFGVTNFLFQLVSKKNDTSITHHIILYQPITQQEYINNKAGKVSQLEMVLEDGSNKKFTDKEISGAYTNEMYTLLGINFISVASIEATPELIKAFQQCSSYRFLGTGNGTEFKKWKSKVNGTIELFLEDNPSFLN